MVPQKIDHGITISRNFISEHVPKKIKSSVLGICTVIIIAALFTIHVHIIRKSWKKLKRPSIMNG